MHYYNEFDRYAARWIGNLIDAGLIPPGHVDDRDIREVTHDDIKGYTQHHFFCGIAGWPIALQLAGWNTTWPVWTASCPCQPLSCAGKGLGEQDERHLWPELYRLASEYQPGTIFGEQVASKDGFEWLDGVSLDLEETGYRVAAADLPAASVGAPHIRQRLFWVADAKNIHPKYRRAGEVEGTKPAVYREERQTDGPATGTTSAPGGVADAESSDRGLPVLEGRPRPEGVEPIGRGEASEVADTERERTGAGEQGEQGQAGQRWDRPTVNSQAGWSDYTLVPCDESIIGKGIVARRTQPGVHPLAHGISQRAPKLRAYGNAIVPQVAAEFIGAYMDCLGITPVNCSNKAPADL